MFLAGVLPGTTLANGIASSYRNAPRGERDLDRALRVVGDDAVDAALLALEVLRAAVDRGVAEPCALRVLLEQPLDRMLEVGRLDG
jgi:hypothetical protein